MDCSSFLFVGVWMRGICPRACLCVYPRLVSGLCHSPLYFGRQGLSLTWSLVDSGAHHCQLRWSPGLCLILTTLVLESWHVQLTCVLGSYLRPMLSQKHFILSQLLFLENTVSVNCVNFLGACFCHLGLQPSGSLQSPFQFAFI